MLRLQDETTFKIDWESLAACFQQVTKVPIDTRHVDIAPALYFITRNMVEPLDVAAVVAALPVGRRTLERRFETHLGVSIRRAITLVRLEIARQLLGRTRLSTTAVSVEVGFSSSSQMANVFRRELGDSPRAIRRVRANGAAQTPAPGICAGSALVVQLSRNSKRGRASQLRSLFMEAWEERRVLSVAGNLGPSILAHSAAGHAYRVTLGLKMDEMQRWSSRDEAGQFLGVRKSRCRL